MLPWPFQAKRGAAESDIGSAGNHSGVAAGAVTNQELPYQQATRTSPCIIETEVNLPTTKTVAAPMDM